MADPEQNVYSLLVRFDETTKTFTTGRIVSKTSTGGRFVHGALHASGTDVFLFGTGRYRASPLYLSKTPTSGFWTGTGTQYFAGMANGQPTWANSESDATPVLPDPSIGDMSVAYSSDLGLWLMTYDAGWQTQEPNGVYFTYAPQPWGPWATPQLIFESSRDKGLGVFIHDPSVKACPPGDGLLGPLVGGGDACPVHGVAFAPLLIERFTKVASNTLKIYYTMGTYNPYTVVKMRSDFTISTAPATTAPVITMVANAEGESATIAPNTWVEIKGLNLAPPSDTRIWQGSDFVNGKMPTQLDGVSVTVNGKSAFVYYVSPTQVNILTPPDAMQGPVQVEVTNNGASSTPAIVVAQSQSPSFFVFNGGPYAAATHVDGSLLGPTSLYPGSTTPAKPGETVVLYANGFGPVSTPVVNGASGQLGSLSPLPVVTIGVIAATVQFAGLVAPGQFQFNIVIPPNVPNGDNALTATHNGATTSPTALITIQGPAVFTPGTFYAAPNGNDAWSGMLPAPNAFPAKPFKRAADF